jgi:hypothetical protein
MSPARRSSFAARTPGLTCGRPGGADDHAIRRALDEVVDERVRYLRFTDMRGRIVSSKSDAVIPQRSNVV